MDKLRQEVFPSDCVGKYAKFCILADRSDCVGHDKVVNQSRHFGFADASADNT